MFAEWSAECSPDDPVVVVPWEGPTGQMRFIDLRSDPYELYSIPEAEQHPALMQALRALNAPRSPVFTAKCDVWAMDEQELADIRLNLDLQDDLARAGSASYIDLLWRDRGLFTSNARIQQMLDRVVRIAAAVESSSGMLELVMRPALLDLDETQEGYAVSLYVKAAGSDATHAYEEWSRALTEVVRLLRGREFASR